MQRYLIRRLMFMVPTLIVMSMFTFGLLRLMPGDFITAQMAEARGADQAQIERWRRELGLDKPAYIQYFRWTGGILRGDWGTSYWQNEPVLKVIKRTLPTSLELGSISILIGVMISVPVGVISAVKQNTWMDYLGRSVSILGISIPNFFLATLVIIYGARWFGWFPPQTAQHLFESPIGWAQQFLPASFILGAALSAQNMRLIRTTMLETIRADYVRTARAKGLKESAVIFKHAFRNALIPVVTLLGFQVTITIGGSVVVERALSVNGMGRAFIDAVPQRDFPLVQGILLLLVGVTLVINLLVDLSYSYLDPRIRYS